MANTLAGNDIERCKSPHHDKHNEESKHRSQNLLGEWRATAICANDITGSCLYVSTVSAYYAGALAPFCLLLVSAVLYLFRDVYAEVGSALPYNGGAYSVLLHSFSSSPSSSASSSSSSSSSSLSPSTSPPSPHTRRTTSPHKSPPTTGQIVATLGACLTMLSYVATAVISACSAAEYLNTLITLDLITTSVALLFIFAVLTLVGVRESSGVAVAIFGFHLVTLFFLICFCMAQLLTNQGLILMQNLHQPPPAFTNDKRAFAPLIALFFGYSSALLGLTGFETSANFIEEQAPGVFPLTLTNMWWCVTIINPLVSLMSLAVLPLEVAGDVHHAQDLLAKMAMESAGRWLSIWVSIDAITVLSGGVLTSYVGVLGLVHRMSGDGLLPTMFQQPKWSILAFFLVTASLLVALHGNLLVLASVFALAFLGVMILFGVGNLKLKHSYPGLRRDTTAQPWKVVTALTAVSVGLVGNVLMDYKSVKYFFCYFIVIASVVGSDLIRTYITHLIHNKKREWEKQQQNEDNDTNKHRHRPIII